MKITPVNACESAYEDLRSHAGKTDWKASGLIREASELFGQLVMQLKTSLLNRRPASLDGPIAAITEDDDILGGMLDNV